MTSEKVSKQLTAAAFAALKASHRDSVTRLLFSRRRFSHASETTFGRALSGCPTSPEFFRLLNLSYITNFIYVNHSNDLVIQN